MDPFKELVYCKLEEYANDIRPAYYNFCQEVLSYEGEGIFSSREDKDVFLQFIEDLCRIRPTPSIAVRKFIDYFDGKKIAQDLESVHEQYLKEYNNGIKILRFGRREPGMVVEIY